MWLHLHGLLLHIGVPPWWRCTLCIGEVCLIFRLLFLYTRGVFKWPCACRFPFHMSKYFRRFLTNNISLVVAHFGLTFIFYAPTSTGGHYKTRRMAIANWTCVSWVAYAPGNIAVNVIWIERIQCLSNASQHVLCTHLSSTVYEL